MLRCAVVSVGARRLGLVVVLARLLGELGWALLGPFPVLAQDEEEAGRLAQTDVSPLPPLGGPSTFGDPITLGELTPTYSVTDLTINDSLGPVSLQRHY